MAQQITENMIREAAYFLWEKAGRPDGSAEYFWMKACEQFFKPKKVEIKKPVAKKAQPQKEKKAVVAPVKKVVAPAKKVVVPAKKVVKPAQKTIKVSVRPAAATVKTAKKVTLRVQPKPRQETATVPFYGSRK